MTSQVGMSFTATKFRTLLTLKNIRSILIPPKNFVAAVANMNKEIENLIGPANYYKENYERIRELGRGKFGVVYEVRSKLTQRDFAAKHVRARKHEVREKIAEEIKLLSRLNHPHIIHFESAYSNAAEIILLTEYLSGGELFERVATEEFYLTEAECVQFMRQICDGVKYLHEEHIVHLDLKPENIVCCRPDSLEVKIIDFGLAKELHPGDEVKVMCGTAEFLAPEVVNYDPVSFASDMWSLGVIAYVLLSGLSPFMGDTVPETYTNVLRAEYDFDDPEFDDITLEAKEFISNLLLKDPSKRLTASQCLEHSWLKTDTQFEAMTKKINTTNLRKFLARRRWQRCGQAIRAMKRMSGLMLKRKSTQSFSTDSADEDPESPNSRNLSPSFGAVSTDEGSSSNTPSPGANKQNASIAQFVIPESFTSSITLQIDG